jgi:hypothetical protein
VCDAVFVQLDPELRRLLVHRERQFDGVSGTVLRAENVMPSAR